MPRVTSSFEQPPSLMKHKSSINKSPPKEQESTLPLAPSLMKAKSSFFKTPSAPDKDKQAASSLKSNDNDNSSFLKPPKPAASTSAESQLKIGPPKIVINVAPKPTPELSQGQDKGGNALKLAISSQGVKPKTLLFDATPKPTGLATIPEVSETKDAAKPGKANLFEAMAKGGLVGGSGGGLFTNKPTSVKVSTET